MRETESSSDDPAVSKQLLDLMRMRGRPDVEILGTAFQEQVADAAADEVCDVMVFVKPIKNFERVRIDVAARYGVLCAGYDGRLRHRANYSISGSRRV